MGQLGRVARPLSGTAESRFREHMQFRLFGIGTTADRTSRDLRRARQVQFRG